MTRTLLISIGVRAALSSVTAFAQQGLRAADALTWYRKAVEPRDHQRALAESTWPAAVSIFVGPTTREGFVDIDRGVLDSINDIKHELERKQMFRVVTEKAQAQLTLEVVSRGATSSSNGGAVATHLGTSTVLIPIGTIGLATVLRAGSYEKPIMVQDCKAWRACASLVVKDVEVWVDANIGSLATMK